MSAFERTLRRGDKQIFDTLTLQNQVAQTDANGDVLLDSHGNVRWEPSKKVEVPGEIVARGRPNYAKHAEGIDRNVDAIVWVSDPTVIFTSGRSDRSVKGTRVIEDNRVYAVVEVYDERNGRLRGHVEMEENAST